jgi:hypothetical protein
MEAKLLKNSSPNITILFSDFSFFNNFRKILKIMSHRANSIRALEMLESGENSDCQIVVEEEQNDGQKKKVNYMICRFIGPQIYHFYGHTV